MPTPAELARRQAEYITRVITGMKPGMTTAHDCYETRGRATVLALADGTYSVKLPGSRKAATMSQAEAVAAIVAAHVGSAEGIPAMTDLTPGTYAIASRLIGFANSELRVKITRVELGYVWIVTADLLDAGTPLTLDASQVTPEQAATVESHRAGLVTFG